MSSPPDTPDTPDTHYLTIYNLHIYLDQSSVRRWRLHPEVSVSHQVDVLWWMKVNTPAASLPTAQLSYNLHSVQCDRWMPSIPSLDRVNINLNSPNITFLKYPLPSPLMRSQNWNWNQRKKVDSLAGSGWEILPVKSVRFVFFFDSIFIS